MENHQQQRSLPTVSTSDAETTTTPVSSISVKLPPYWPSDPALWFSQVEAQFTTRGVTAELTKYAYVVGSLQPEVAQEVRDLLINRPIEEPYTTLKTALIKRTSVSEQQRIHQLLTTEELGDRKPTQFLRRMQQLLGDKTLEPTIMKQLFLQRLPTNIQLILAPNKDTMDIASLAKLADNILEVAPTHTTLPALATVVPQPQPSTSAQSTELSELRELVSQLTTTINTFSRKFTPSRTSHDSRCRSRSPSPIPAHRNDSTTSQHPRSPVCWYHSKFGASAKKCSPPCSYTSRSSPSNYSARQ